MIDLLVKRRGVLSAGARSRFGVGGGGGRPAPRPTPSASKLAHSKAPPHVLRWKADHVRSVLPVRTCFAVYFVLIGLTALTVGAAFLDL